MKKTIIILLSACICCLPAVAQGVIDALPALSGQLQGSARYSSMGGAFGALGGDLTSIRQNPAGIGVYRSSEVSVTAGLNFYNNNVTTPTSSSKNDGFYFTGDNLGIVGVIKFKSGIMRNLNFGFAYNNIANYNNKYNAYWDNINSSLTEMIAANSSSLGILPSDLAISGSYDPYMYDMSWISVLAYNTYLMNPTGENSDKYTSIYRQGTTTGRAELETFTSGAIDEYDFNISGNMLDKFYWGVTLNVTNINYNIDSYYGEALQNAEVAATADGRVSVTDGSFVLQNTLTTKGVGVGVKLGVIYRPINYLRLGVAFHSPTYYDMTDTYMAAVGYQFSDVNGKAISGSRDDINNQTNIGQFKYNLTTPWHIMASAAAVLGKSAIISFDYEYIDAPAMYYSGSVDYANSSNMYIKEQMQGVHNLRVGAEYRITPSLSLRAGYAYESSPMKSQYYDGSDTPQVVDGTLTQYHIPNDAHNISCGVGYRINNVNIDLAYVHRMQDYSIYPYATAGSSYKPTIMDMHHNSVKLSVGYRF